MKKISLYECAMLTPIYDSQEGEAEFMDFLKDMIDMEKTNGRSWQDEALWYMNVMFRAGMIYGKKQERRKHKYQQGYYDACAKMQKLISWIRAGRPAEEILPHLEKWAAAGRSSEAKLRKDASHKQKN